MCKLFIILVCYLLTRETPDGMAREDKRQKFPHFNTDNNCMLFRVEINHSCLQH